jgi:hypothetical protein
MGVTLAGIIVLHVFEKMIMAHRPEHDEAEILGEGGSGPSFRMNDDGDVDSRRCRHQRLTNIRIGNEIGLSRCTLSS